MADKWGFKVALRSRDKACRTVYRLSQRDGSCLLDQSYMRTLRIHSEQSYSKISEVLQLKEDMSSVQRRNLSDEQLKLVCPVDCVVIPSTREVLLQIHPSALLTVLDILRALKVQVEILHMNSFQIISQLCSLQHIFNVLQPLCCDDSSSNTLDCIKELQFDQGFINQNQVIYLNLRPDKLSGDFRMNERTFNYEMSSQADDNQRDLTTNPLFRDTRADQAHDGKINKTSRPSTQT